MWQRIIALCVFVISASEAVAEKRVALVIGNSNYQYTTSLKNPNNDATDISATFQRLGFKVITAKDQTVSELTSSLSKFSQELQSSHVGLLWYAGHGIQYQGRNYIIPVDAKLENEFSIGRETVPFDEIISAMENYAKINLIFIDACRNNPLTDRLFRSMQRRARNVRVGSGLARMSVNGQNTLLVFATAPGEVADDGIGRNSPFAEAVLRHIETPNLDIEVIMKDVTRDVRKATDNRQRPERLSKLDMRLVLRSANFDADPSSTKHVAKPQPDFSSQDDRLFWQSVQGRDDKGLYEAYLRRFPSGIFSDIARIEIARLSDRERQKPYLSQPNTLNQRLEEFNSSNVSINQIRSYLTNVYLLDKEKFTDVVDYYDKGRTDRHFVLEDKKKYALRWPYRRYDLIDGSIKIITQDNKNIVVAYGFRFELRNGSRSASGTGRVQLSLLKQGTSFLVSGAKEIVSKN